MVYPVMPGKNPLISLGIKSPTRRSHPPLDSKLNNLVQLIANEQKNRCLNFKELSCNLSLDIRIGESVKYHKGGFEIVHSPIT